MTVKALGPYEFPSADRAENFGDDMLVHVLWSNNMMMCSAACFRAPKNMPFEAFKSQMVDAWASSDPDYDPAAVHDWRLDGKPFTAENGQSLADLGIVHKGLISFQA
jgi:phenol/toluene 2-monooxygenase (NADH) P4/A4